MRTFPLCGPGGTRSNSASLALLAGDQCVRAPRRHDAISSKPLRKRVGDPPRSYETTDANAVRAQQAELDKLPFVEVLTQVVVHTVVDRQVISRKEVREVQGSVFRIGEIRRVHRLFQGAHEILGQAVVNRILIAHGHAAATLIVERNPQSHQLGEARTQRAALRQRTRNALMASAACGRCDKISWTARLVPRPGSTWSSRLNSGLG